MNSDFELKRRFRHLRDQVAQTPSMVDEVMRRVEKTSIAPVPPVPYWRRRLMQSTVLPRLKWAVPIGIAAAIVLLIGIWPQGGKNGAPGGSGRVYGMSDIPGLLKAARTMHLRHTLYLRNPNEPDNPDKAESEIWLDFQMGRRFTSRRDHSEPPELGFQHEVCDGEYVMEEYTAKSARGNYSLGVRFKKLTPYQAMLETRQGELLTRLFGQVDQVAGFTLTGQEVLAGESFNIWEGTVQMLPPQQPYHFKVWLSPTSGNIARVQYWDEPPDGTPWRMFVDFEQIERDVALPEDLFSTEPRPGYKLENTKENAPVQVLGASSGVENVEPYALHQHISFRLPDGTVLFGWGVWDKSNSDQEPLFSGLVPGGALPDLPARPVSLTAVPPQEGLTYVGKHLAYTRFRKDYCVEWAVYVPNRPPSPVLTYQCDVEYAADKDKFGSWFEGTGGSLPIGSAEEFDSWVLGAMADLSETGSAPAHVTYEFTLGLCAQIRTELETSKAMHLPGW